MDSQSILIIDDEEDILSVLEEKFSRAGFDITLAKNGPDALAAVHLNKPDLILLDVMMDGMDGMEVKRRLNQDIETAAIPVIFLTANVLTENKVMGFELQAEDYVSKPFEFVELLARVNALLHRHKKNDQKLCIDPLTGISNAYMYEKSIKRLLDIAKNQNIPFSLIIIDLDHFKSINDTYGHQIGDLVLKHTANLLKSSFRAEDILIRYGGDEFVLLLPETNQKEAANIVKRFKKELSTQMMMMPECTGINDLRFSMSIGMAAYTPTIRNGAGLFEIADRDMYKDKKRKVY